VDPHRRVLGRRGSGPGHATVRDSSNPLVPSAALDKGPPATRSRKTESWRPPHSLRRVG
jgi:hypothetical protein